MVYKAYKYKQFPDRLSPLLGGNDISLNNDPTPPLQPPGLLDPPAGYSLYYARDFTVANASDDANWAATNGTAGNHIGIMRPQNVIKNGPNGQELICTMADSGSPIYTGAVRNYGLHVNGVSWYLRAVFRTVNMQFGFWPSLWMRPVLDPVAGVVLPNDGEPDLIEVFGGHIAFDANGVPTGLPNAGHNRIAGTTMILGPYDNPADPQVNLTTSLDQAVPLNKWDTWNKFEWYKTPLKLQGFVNDKLAITINAPATNPGRQKWIDQMEDPLKRYYVRLDAQAGTLPGHVEAGDFKGPWPVECRQQMTSMVIAHPS